MLGGNCSPCCGSCPTYAWVSEIQSAQSLSAYVIYTFTGKIWNTDYAIGFAGPRALNKVSAGLWRSDDFTVTGSVGISGTIQITYAIEATFFPDIAGAGNIAETSRFSFAVLRKTPGTTGGSSEFPGVGIIGFFEFPCWTKTSLPGEQISSYMGAVCSFRALQRRGSGAATFTIRRGGSVVYSGSNGLIPWGGNFSIDYDAEAQIINTCSGDYVSGSITQPITTTTTGVRFLYSGQQQVAPGISLPVVFNENVDVFFVTANLDGGSQNLLMDVGRSVWSPDNASIRLSTEIDSPYPLATVQQACGNPLP